MSGDTDSLAKQILAGDRRALARAITLVESARPEDRDQAAKLLEQLAPHSGNSIRIGISGVPGVGKSTFIESMGMHLIKEGHKVAVLAVDPSSAVSGGSILGDKTRMEELSRELSAFIRPSPAGKTLGGVTRHTQETMLMVEAAGFDVVLVETVGVGQSETAVARMTDMFLLLLLPGAGDELQGIKRGIVELADLILVNKADGDMKQAAERAVIDYKNALHFLHPRSSNWEVAVETYSALEGTGCKHVWETVQTYKAALDASDEFTFNRSEQARAWMWNEISESLLDQLRDDPKIAAEATKLEQAVTAGKLSPTTAAHQLIESFLKH
jgi:LAO/AO transport system kinase